MSCTCATLFSGWFVHVLRGIWNLQPSQKLGSCKFVPRFQGLDGRCEQQKKFWRESKIGRILQDSSLLVKQWWGWDAKRYKSSVRRNIKKQFGTCINVSWMYQQTNSLHKLLQLRGCWRHAEYGGLPSKRYSHGYLLNFESLHKNLVSRDKTLQSSNPTLFPDFSFIGRYCGISWYCI